jgi:xanthine/uracil permease
MLLTSGVVPAAVIAVVLNLLLPLEVGRPVRAAG